MKISVQKYNPSVDAEPYFGTYEIEHTEHMTLLEALVVINDIDAYIAGLDVNGPDYTALKDTLSHSITAAAGACAAVAP